MPSEGSGDQPPGEEVGGQRGGDGWLRTRSEGTAQNKSTRIGGTRRRDEEKADEVCDGNYIFQYAATRNQVDVEYVAHSLDIGAMVSSMFLNTEVQNLSRNR